jgi:hypothetical protein
LLEEVDRWEKEHAAGAKEKPAGRRRLPVVTA